MACEWWGRRSQTARPTTHISPFAKRYRRCGRDGRAMGKFDTKMYIFPLLLFLFCMTSCGEPPSLRTSRIDVDRSSPEGKSQFVPAISHVDTTFNDSHTN